MASKEQKKAFKNYRAPLRKVILATNIGKCNNYRPEQPNWGILTVDVPQCGNLAIFLSL